MKTKLIIIALASVFTFALIAQEQRDPRMRPRRSAEPDARSVSKLSEIVGIRERAADAVYFPKGAEHYYPKHLEAMKEPSLYEQRTNKTVEQYRFLWLRTFHKPIAVRIRKNSAGITLRVIRLTGAGGYDPGQIEHDESFALTADQWHDFLKLLAKSSFWDSPGAEKDTGGFDGSQWILEGQAAGKYHVVDRWAPTADGDKRRLESFVACCRYLLKLSKQEIPKKDDY